MESSRRWSACGGTSQLQQYVLDAVTPTGLTLGKGSFGSVVELLYQHRICAGKKIHELLLNKGTNVVIEKYLRECQLMSSLRHPNITQFLGLCFLPDAELPLLVMECLETNLGDLLENMPNLPLSLKRSVLEDVASGLLYLHKMEPPIIHRDLTSKNVLLTSSLVAKITDMGNSRIVDLRPDQMAMTLTKFPGTLLYMPPEALDDKHQYGPTLDIFSFGHLALYTMIQKFPRNLPPPTYVDPDNKQRILARSEVERRDKYITLLESRSPLLAVPPLIKQCLHNDPQQRPSTEELLIRLQEMRAEVEGEYGGAIKVDLGKFKLAKKLRERDKKIEEQEKQLAEMARTVDDTTEQMQIQKRDLQQAICRHVEAKDELTRRVEKQERRIQGLEAQLEVLQRSLEKRDSEISRLKDRVNTAEEPRLILPFRLVWRQGNDMPFGMSGYIQSSVIQGKVYVGGGDVGRGTSYNNYILMEYDPSLEEWATLPPHKTCDFAMAVVKSQLVLVGGCEDGYESNMLSAWDIDAKQWTYPYPELPTARSRCSAVVYKQWLVVAGGWSEGRPLSCIDLMNSNTKQWYGGPQTPFPWYNAKGVLVGNIGCFLGGHDSSGSTMRSAFCLDIQTLISGVNSEASTVTGRQLWKELHGLELSRSTPISINGSLLSVGGLTKDHKAVTAIHLFQPDTARWVKVGDLPSPRYYCTCAMVTKWDIMVAGGFLQDRLKTFEIAHCTFSTS